MDSRRRLKVFDQLTAVEKVDVETAAQSFRDPQAADGVTDAETALAIEQDAAHAGTPQAV
jgi:hypothetical protein